MQMAALLALTLFLQNREVEDLVRALGADDVEERERAVRRLVELGAHAWPAVAGACRSTDADVAAGARRVRRSFPPDVRMEELYEAGFRRETTAALPGLSARLWSSNARDLLKGLEDLTGVSLLSERPGRRHATREDLAAYAAVFGPDLPYPIRRGCATVMATLKCRELAPCVLPLVSHADRDTREEAMFALAAARVREAAPAIAQWLGHDDSSPAALKALELLGVAPPEDLVRDLLADDKTRHIGLHCAGQFRMDALARDLVDLLRTEKDLRWEVSDKLQRARPGWKDIEPLVGHDAPEVRLQVLRIARRWRMPESADAALRLVDDASDEVRAHAVDLLVDWGDPARLLDKEGPGALVALGRLGARQALPRGRRALESRDAKLRRAGITALRALDAHDATEAIGALLDDESADVRAEAARCFAHFAGDGAGPVLCARLGNEKDARVLARLLDGIAETGCKDAAADVAALLTHADREVVRAAVRASGALRLKDAAPILVQGYVERRVRGYDEAYEALRQIRPDNLVNLIRPYVRLHKKDDDELLRSGWSPVDARREAALYLLYADPPGAGEFVLRSLSEGTLSEHAVDMIRFLHLEGAVPWLMREIEGPHRVRLWGAGSALVSLGHREAVDRAVGWLSSRDGAVRNIAIDVLGGFKSEDKIPEIAKLMDHPDPNLRYDAWNALAWIGGPKAEEIFRRRLTEGTPGSRAWAAMFLRSRSRESIPSIEPLLDDPDPGVRKTAADALMWLEATGSFDRILRASEGAREDDLRTWLPALALTGGARGREIARRFLKHENREVRVAALSAMAAGVGFEPAEIAAVEASLDDPDVWHEAWQALARMAPERLVRSFEDPRGRLWPGSNWGTACLEQIGPARAVPAAVAFLKSRDTDCRCRAAWLLGKWRARQAVEPLAAALHAEDARTRAAAAVALARMGDPSGVGEILRMPRHVAAGHMAEALVALNAVRHPAVMEKLRAATWSRDESPIRSLREALDRLSRRSGMKLSVSAAIRGDALKRAPSWQPETWDIHEVAVRGDWARFVAIVVEPDEIRVLPTDEALVFWQSWARERGR